MDFENNIITDFNHALLSLSKYNSYAEFGYHLNHTEENILASIKVNHSIYASDHIATTSIDTFKLDLLELLQNVGNTPELSNCAVAIISKITDPILQYYPSNSIVIGCSAAGEQDPIYWHIDGKPHYDNYYGKKYRISLAFKGDSTIFCKTPICSKEKLNCNEDNPTCDEDNPTCDEANVYSPKPNNGVIFLQNHALHSSPLLKDERLALFISF